VQAHPEDYVIATYCPVCRRNLGTEFMPPHDDGRGRPCKGSGKFGATKAATERKRLDDSKADRDWVTKPGTVSGGLPSLGRKRR
jgi:hypothetical protein